VCEKTKEKEKKLMGACISEIAGAIGSNLVCGVTYLAGISAAN